MACEHDWWDGVERGERGEADPRLDTCPECRRARREHAGLARGLSRLGEGAAPAPGWQTRVWDRIGRDQAAAARRMRWLGAGLAVAGVAVVVLAAQGRPPSIAGARPRIEIVSSPPAVRSTSARAGDRVRISAVIGQEVRVYRGDRLALRCRSGVASPGCAPDARGLIAEARLPIAGDYQVVLITVATAEPAGSLDRDLAAVVSAGGDYRVTELSVR